MISGIVIKNFSRIYKKIGDDYFNYPWPKMYSFTEKNYRNKNLKVFSKDMKFLYYKPSPYTLCMYSKSPCTANPDVGDIKIKNKYGYKIYYFDY